MAAPFTFEICVDSVASCLAAEAAGAHRVELCAGLLEGGLTPSFGTLVEARRAVNLKLMVLIRPRGGDFCYSDSEFRVMQEDVRLARELGADGVAIGLLNPDGTIDQSRTRALMDLAGPLSVTFHRAFDMARDPYEALDAVLALGCDRVLTSGQESSALEGSEVIRELITRAGERLVVMPGGGIRERNLTRIAALTGAREFHFSASEAQESRMTYRNGRVFMGGTLRPPEFSHGGTSEARIRAFTAQLEA